jgi:hypothetical protein
MPNIDAAPRVRESSEDEKRAAGRKKVEQAARRGESPREYYAADELAWAYHGRADELDELEAVAEAARVREREKHRNRDQTREVEKVTAIVLTEMLKAEQTERQSRARAEALRRLGLTEDGT